MGCATCAQLTTTLRRPSPSFSILSRFTASALRRSVSSDSLRVGRAQHR